MFNNGGMLTGAEILKQVKKGNIKIDPFDENQLNPNSYNLRLDSSLAIYSRGADRSEHIPIHCYDMADGEFKRITPDIAPECPFAESYQLAPIDMKKDNELIRFDIPKAGYVLRPRVLYLGRTKEHTFTDKYIPMINGRSSGGRLGISIHVCAGFGDIGFDGTWTLEITAVEPVIIYPDVEIAQICYFSPVGSKRMLYNGRYNKQVETTGSRFFKPKEEVYK